MRHPDGRTNQQELLDVQTLTKGQISFGASADAPSRSDGPRRDIARALQPHYFTERPQENQTLADFDGLSFPGFSN
jgi:hypothetical protein